MKKIFYIVSIIILVGGFILGLFLKFSPTTFANEIDTINIVEYKHSELVFALDDKEITVQGIEYEGEPIITATAEEFEKFLKNFSNERVLVFNIEDRENLAVYFNLQLHIFRKKDIKGFTLNSDHHLNTYNIPVKKLFTVLDIKLK